MCARFLLAVVLSAAPLSVAKTQSPTSVGPDSPGTLHPGDRIQLKIWREPDLSDTLLIDQQGVAVFPKLGPLHVTGIPQDSLRKLLVAQYARFLVNPTIDVTFLYRINISGAVRNPGLYYVNPTMTVADAVAQAGGPTPEGRLHRVQLYRNERRMDVDVGSHSSLTAVRSGDRLYVPQRSWLGRNAYAVLGGISAVTSLVFLLVR